MEYYTFKWQCDEAFGEVEIEISDDEVELIKEAYRDAFEQLEDDSDLDELRKRVLESLDFYDSELEQDIRIYFPEKITEEVDDEE